MDVVVKERRSCLPVEVARRRRFLRVTMGMEEIWDDGKEGPAFSALVGIMGMKNVKSDMAGDYRTRFRVEPRRHRKSEIGILEEQRRKGRRKKNLVCL